MNKHKPCRERRPLNHSLLLLLMSACALTANAQQDESTVVYERNYFDQFNPVSLEDMIQYIPGGSAILRNGGGPQGGGNGRGFGASDTQILINGRRMSGKVNNMSTALARIQADQVERIELIRGNAEGLDIRNEGIIYNVILQEGATNTSSSFVDASINHIEGLSPEPSVLASYNATRGALDWGISYERESRPRLELTDEQIFNPDRSPREFRRQSQENDRVSDIITATMGYEFVNGTLLRLNGLYSDNSSDQSRHEDQFIGREGDAAAPFAIETAGFNDKNKE
ncbi:MAG: TonB-dependent receptor plug domain-containing protein, partial [Gammaproteobacteria bacterium]